MKTGCHKQMGKKVEQLVCHYTNFESFKSIINTKTIYATSFKDVNDGTEFIHARDVMRPILYPYFQDLLKEEYPNEVFLNEENVYENLLQRIYDNDKVDHYIFCASKYENDDGLLGMWRGYGKPNDGIGIILRVSPGDFDGFVTYGTELNNFDQDLVKKHDFNNVIKCVSDVGTSKCEDINEDLKLLGRIGILYKHRGFSEECEYRVCYIPSDSNEVKTRQYNNRSINYMEIELNINQDIEKIVIGPSCRQNLIEQKVNSLLYDKNLGHIQVVRSSIPFLWDL